VSAAGIAATAHARCTGRQPVERAEDRGADELVSAAEWILRNNPGALAAVRSRYRRFCEYVARIIERES
jgi:hypothetical protein